MSTEGEVLEGREQSTLDAIVMPTDSNEANLVAAYRACQRL